MAHLPPRLTEEEFETPLPGKEVGEVIKLELLREFLSRYRVFPKGEVPSNVPTACLIEGHVVDISYTTSAAFQSFNSVYFFIESGDIPANEILRRCSPRDVASYLQARETWEDYDICIFDDSLSWCLAISHNELYVVCQRS